MESAVPGSAGILPAPQPFGWRDFDGTSTTVGRLELMFKKLGGIQ
jgi:hypothetical protein